MDERKEETGRGGVVGQGRDDRGNEVGREGGGDMVVCSSLRCLYPYLLHHTHTLSVPLDVGHGSLHNRRSLSPRERRCSCRTEDV